MSLSTARRVAKVTSSIFTEINQYAAQYDTVNLGQGKPDFDGPSSVIEAAVDALRSGEANQYAPSWGILPLRERIAEHAQHFYQLAIDPERGVVVTSGASEGVFDAIMGLVSPGDEVILLEPYFDIYLPAVEWAGGVPVFVPMHPPTWELDSDELRAAFNEKTRLLILNTPHNPTGRVFSPEELALIAELCQHYDALVISDEVYEHLTYDGAQHTPIATLPGMFERTLTVSSAAKTFSLTGWKVGWVCGPPDLLMGVWGIHQNVTFAVNHPAQYGIAHALSLGADYYEELQRMYNRKREILRAALTNAGIGVNYAPNGAFYIMGDYSEIFQGSDQDFARWLIREYGVACIPPSPFYSEAHKSIAQGYARFSYCKHDRSLHQAAERLATRTG